MLSLILPITFFLLTFWGFFNQKQDLSEVVATFILTYGTIWGVTLVIGLVLKKLTKSIRKQTVLYVSIQSLFVLAIPAKIVIDRYKDDIHQQKFGNIEDNRSFMRFTSDSTGSSTDSTYRTTKQWIAFEKLESEFKDPNSFSLGRGLYFKKDTLINAIRDSVFFAYFIYTYAGENKYAKIRVIDNRATIEVFNGDITNSEFQRIKSKYDAGRKESIESLKRTLDIMPDSESQQVVDTAIKMTEKNTR